MSSKSIDKQASLKRRIRKFYTLLNARRFDQCYQLIDPRLLEKPGTVTRFQYEQSLGEFLDQVESVHVRKLVIVGLHLNEPSKLYEGRDFALVKTVWGDAKEEAHEFSERWVCEGPEWYTRSTGLLKPADPAPPLLAE